MTIPQTLTSLFTPYECEVHSWCVRMGMIVLGIGIAIALPVLLS